MTYTIRIQLAAYLLAVFSAGAFNWQSPNNGISTQEATAILFFGFMNFVFAVGMFLARDLMLEEKQELSNPLNEYKEY